jgi:hypothetical protein
MSDGINEDRNMPRKKHTPEEMVAKLREVDVLGLRWPALCGRSG